MPDAPGFRQGTFLCCPSRAALTASHSQRPPRITAEKISHDHPSHLCSNLPHDVPLCPLPHTQFKCNRTASPETTLKKHYTSERVYAGNLFCCINSAGLLSLKQPNNFSQLYNQALQYLFQPHTNLNKQAYPITITCKNNLFTTISLFQEVLQWQRKKPLV